MVQSYNLAQWIDFWFSEEAILPLYDSAQLI